MDFAAKINMDDDQSHLNDPKMKPLDDLLDKEKISLFH